MKLPMREKYVDELVGTWFIFGSRDDGTVDVNNGTDDIFEGIPKEVADKLVQVQQKFREELYTILCR